ncbi:cyclin-like protein [Laetiporus sulphureus 93-53]|uniref:Cyclin-like protein n=1 Tax=Laetiporus sulphureus 93-53 TaxID=1314785 RepID=A0A165H8L1_9APHY|nr:cyclin-like protein [Laetiporus sulphureus 93-53]KZT11393.1 cyclin-like protein [Laetiporus sulphureus 93-53]
MGATKFLSSSSSQWLFPVSALQYTPSHTTSAIPRERELYDRARGVEFLFRLGVSLQLPISAMYTAATWFHRFYMRYSMEDYHRQDVAASCVFLATKTEECGRKLRDVAKVFYSKVSKIDIAEISDDNKELEMYQQAILATEEVLLEALCFDFVVDSPHAELVDLFNTRQESEELEECAWTIANDTTRTPLCILHPPRIIAAACYILAQHIIEGPQSPSLDVRIASPAPSASLPTPPSHNLSSPEASRFAVDYFEFNEVDLAGVAETLNIILEFYAAQDLQHSASHLVSVAAIPPPAISATRERLYTTFNYDSKSASQPSVSSNGHCGANQTPTSSHGGSTPGKPQPKAWRSVINSPK